MADPVVAPAAPQEPAAVPSKEKPDVAESKPDVQTITQALKKIKVDGKDYELPEDELIRYAQKGFHADKELQAVAKIKRDLDLTNQQLAGFFQKLKEDPLAVISDPRLGIDARKAAESYLWREIQKEQMTPEQRRLEELEHFKRQKEIEEQEYQKKQEEEQFNSETEKKRQFYQENIINALKEEGLPSEPAVVKRMAEHIKYCKMNGIEVDFKKIASNVREDFIKWIGSFTSGLPDEKVYSTIPEEFIKRLRKEDLRRLREKGLAPKPGPKSEPSKKESTTKKMTTEEWLESIRQQRG